MMRRVVFYMVEIGTRDNYIGPQCDFAVLEINPEIAGGSSDPIDSAGFFSPVSGSSVCETNRAQRPVKQWLSLLLRRHDLARC